MSIPGNCRLIGDHSTQFWEQFVDQRFRRSEAHAFAEIRGDSDAGALVFHCGIVASHFRTRGDDGTVDCALGLLLHELLDGSGERNDVVVLTLVQQLVQFVEGVGQQEFSGTEEVEDVAEQVSIPVDEIVVVSLVQHDGDQTVEHFSKARVHVPVEK